MVDLTKPVFRISIPNTFHDFFDYYAGDDEPSIGARVWVPFRKKTRLGVVIGKDERTTTHAKIKTIMTVIDKKPLLSGELLALCFWVSSYYQSPLSEVIPLVLPKKYRCGDIYAPPITHYYRLKGSQLVTPKAPRQRELLECIRKEPQGVSKKTLLQAGFTSVPLKALLTRGLIEVYEEPEKPPSSLMPLSAPLSLNPEQAFAVDTIGSHLHAYHGFLLHGVTGSGKTEVYLQVIAKVLNAGRQVLVIVPEIGLTPQLLDRFRARFALPMVVIHSRLNDTERQKAWLWANDEAAKLVIGTRAAIFTPMPGLGLIVVDEEHDASFKQMEGVRYSARDTALMRAHLRHIPIILGSATPSLESLYNCSVQKYSLLRLHQKALTSSPLHYDILDIRNLVLQHGLANRSLQVIREHLERQNQVLVFINRRGFAPILMCHQCGWMADCRACDAHLTLHRKKGQLICHHCGLTQRIPLSCPHCHSQELLPIGAGTQRIFDYLREVFPTTSMLRIDRDEVTKKEALERHLEKIATGEAQLIVGTQMLTKGHHFPRLTLVVILDTDNGFYNQDFRALERLGQLLIQVAGRAGRAEFPGQVLIQTHLPQHPLLNLLIQEGYDRFAESLLLMRQKAELPPYHFLTLIRVEGKTLPPLLNFLSVMKKQLQIGGLEVLGPAPAPLCRKAGFHRLQLLVKSSSRQQLKASLSKVRLWLAANKTGQGLRWSVDVDPVELC